MAEKKLHIKMFGGFSTRYGDEVLTFGRQRNSKFGQLFQILMTRPGKDFNKKDIAEILYGSEQVEDMNASLNNTIFRLRKYLRQSPLPEGEYLVLSGGALRFDGGIGVESDVWSFTCAGEAFQAERNERDKAEICKRAYALYRGEFLPSLANELWVIEKSREYKNLYTQMMEFLLSYLGKEGDFAGVEAMAARAAELYPCEGWERWQIESLVSRGRSQEADRVYRAAEARMERDGDFLSRERRIDLREAGMKMLYPAGSEWDICRGLQEAEAAEGAYHCTLPGFSDCYRMLKRAASRKGAVCFCLFLCTILDSGGRPASSREYCHKMGERLRESFRRCLRKGDVYTEYSENQYLLLCIGAKKKDVLQISTRIAADVRKQYGGRGEIRYRLLDDGSMW